MIKPETLNSPAKLRELPLEELKAAHLELKASQMKLRLQHAIGQVEKTHQIREARRQRARLLTIMAQVRSGDAAKTAAAPRAPAHAAATDAPVKSAAPAKKTHPAKARPAARVKAKSAAKKPAAKKPAKKAAKKK